MSTLRRETMNSTIKQFAELSKSYKTILVDGQMQSVLLIDPERFAEMIVKECNNLNKQVLTQCNLEHYMVIERLMNKYQDHFGVHNE